MATRQPVGNRAILRNALVLGGGQPTGAGVYAAFALASLVTLAAKSEGPGSKDGVWDRQRQEKGCFHMLIRSLPHVSQNHAGVTVQPGLPSRCSMEA